MQRHLAAIMSQYREIDPIKDMILNLGKISGSEAMIKARQLPRGEEIQKQLEEQRSQYFESKVKELTTRGVNENVVRRLSKVNLTRVLH